MTGFSVGDRVLVPCVVKHDQASDLVFVQLSSGDVEVFNADDLRPERSENAEDRGYQPLPDTGGRDLTANDVADAVREWTAEDTHYAQIAEELNRITRVSPATGTDAGYVDLNPDPRTEWTELGPPPAAYDERMAQHWQDSQGTSVPDDELDITEHVPASDYLDERFREGWEAAIAAAGPRGGDSDG